MTTFYIMTLFPEMVMQCLETSILGRAQEKDLIRFRAFNIRDYTKDKHNKVDDYPYGGGAGMLMQAQPVYDCYLAILEEIGKTSSDQQKKPRVIFLTPTGRTFRQKMAVEFAKEENIILLCGHYEGIDQRVLDKIVTDEISLGDFVLTGGELPAVCLIDAISRMIPGVLSNVASGVDESFSDNLLEYPQYSRPDVWEGLSVPPILLSGDHAKVDAWRHEQSIERTKQKRPDLYERFLKENP